MIRYRISFLLVIIACLAVAACGSPDSGKKDGLETLTVVEVTHSLFYAPQYVAINKGFFKEEGIDVQLIEGFGGDKTMTTLLSGDADIALVGAETAVYVTARGAQNPVVGIAQLTQTDGSFLVSRKPDDDFEWKDLKGKTLLGQRKGGMPEMVSEYVQRKHGLSPHQDVTIIQNVDFKNLGSAYLSGTGDYAQLFEPLASKIEQQGKGYVVASFGKDSGKLPYTVYLTKASTIQENPELLTRYIRAIYKAQQWVDTHSPEEIAEAVAPYFQDTDKEIIVNVLDRYKSQDSWANNPIIDRQEYDHLLEVMDQAGELPGDVSYNEVIHMELAKKAIKKP
ncbi:ABC transporter substrate-binding protein [Marinithermofilum abyssi]|uniref:ABC transporter substrate-binding protein n=1 Tax=Marinithermofilum abyssi TaxID=1571185 RepID=A0A8J2VDT8_9BACL|nr:ABC transporter substrate-binding protein [Marinithermofilum abyssi]GGE18316.1 ABC transporter substrate-binding protein [Marinithermofilum abyssi]